MKRPSLLLAGALLVTVGVVGYQVGRARAFGVPTIGPGMLTYTGSLLTFGQPDNSSHQITVALWPNGASSAACTTGAVTTQVTSGQFTVPLPTACVGVIHQDPNVQVQVTVDSTTLGLAPLTAVPYAIEAGSTSVSPLLSNVGLAASVGSNALTINLTQNDGATAPTASNPAIIGFRALSATSGALSAVQVSSALSITVPPSATLGQASNVPSFTYVFAQDVAGTVQLCVSSSGVYDEGVSQTAVALAASATSATQLYCTTAGIGPVRLVGRVLSTQTTAGAWAASPTAIAIPPFNNAVTNAFAGTWTSYTPTVSSDGSPKASYQLFNFRYLVVGNTVFIKGVFVAGQNASGGGGSFVKLSLPVPGTAGLQQDGIGIVVPSNVSGGFASYRPGWGRIVPGDEGNVLLTTEAPNYVDGNAGGGFNFKWIVDGAYEIP